MATRIIGSLVLAFLASDLCAEPAIKFGYFNHVPHMYMNEKAEASGATVSFIEMLADEAGYQVIWEGPLPVERLQGYLKQGKLDAHPHMLVNANSERYLSFTNRPYHYAQSILAIRKETPLKAIQSLDNIKGFRIGWIDTIPESKFIKAGLGEIKMIRFPPNDSMWKESLLRLVQNRVDAVHELNQFTLEYKARQLGLMDKIRILMLPEDATPVFLGFSKSNKRYSEFVDQFNKVLDRIPFGHSQYENLIRAEMDKLNK